MPDERGRPHLHADGNMTPGLSGAKLREQAVKLYRALKLMPCGCGYVWKGPTRQVRVKTCIRCRAIEEWERELGTT